VRRSASAPDLPRAICFSRLLGRASPSAPDQLNTWMAPFQVRKKLAKIRELIQERQSPSCVLHEESTAVKGPQTD